MTRGDRAADPATAGTAEAESGGAAHSSVQDQTDTGIRDNAFLMSLLPIPPTALTCWRVSAFLLQFIHLFFHRQARHSSKGSTMHDSSPPTPPSL